MFTESPPRKEKLTRFQESERTGTLTLPPQASLRTLAQAIEAGMKNKDTAEVRAACDCFLKLVSGFCRVPVCPVRILASRPLNVRENWSSELFGDYDPSTIGHPHLDANCDKKGSHFIRNFSQYVSS